MNELLVWLESLGLQDYADAFAANKIDFELLPELGDADLKDLGVVALGDRKRLLKAIAALAVDRGSETGLPVEGTRRQAGDGAFPRAGDGALTRPAAPAREAERRQLTVMFCDLVGSTALSGRLDPEDLQRLIRGYHDAVADAVAPYEGHVAQLLGDGALVYFGYPRAHEDDAQRAVRAALAVVRAVANLVSPGDAPMQTRIGIATGLVVVGDIGAGTAAAERTASGETPNLAARLQNQARSGEIVLSGETRRLVGATFDLESLGTLELKGIAGSIEAWRVRGERSVASRFEAQHAYELSPFVGRDSEVSLLVERWTQARDGEGQVVLLSGEAGIGKSRISERLRERLAGEPYSMVLWQCSPYFSSSALYPVVQYLAHTARLNPADPPEIRAQRLEAALGQAAHALPPASLGYLLRLAGLPDGGRLPAGGSAQQEKVQLLSALIELLLEQSRIRPLLFQIEDAHWIDPTTSDLIGQLIERLREARVLLLITHRPEFAAPWGHPAHLTRLTLNRLEQRQCAALVAAVTAGKSLPDEVLEEILRKTDGIPLFVEELTKTVVQSGLLDDTAHGYRLKGPLPALAIPSTLQDSLMARLDRLAPAKEIAQVGAVIGREFSHRLISDVLSVSPPVLQSALDELVRSELVLRSGAVPDALYTFKHALIRDTAYNSMLKSQRVLRHAQVAAALERDKPDAGAIQPELLAYHHQEGGNLAAAFKYWSMAGELAARRSAVRETATHSRAALELFARLAPAGQLPGVELQLQTRLGNALAQTEGFGSPQTFQSYTRARDLALSLGELDAYVAACSGVGTSLAAAGRFSEVIEMFGQLRPDELARLQPMSRVFHGAMIGAASTHLGMFSHAWMHLDDAKRELEHLDPALREPIAGVDAMMLIMGYAIRCRMFQGLLDQADALATRALELADAGRHAPTRAWALQMAGWIALLKGNLEEARRRCALNLEISDGLGLKPRKAGGLLGLGCTLIAGGEAAEGILMVKEGYALWQSTGSKFQCSELASFAAHALLGAGLHDAAQEFVLAGERAQSETEECYVQAELLRQHGRLSEIEGDSARAGTRYRDAIAIARGQGAHLFALRAATDLARLCAGQPAADEAIGTLKSIYEEFTEGFGFPDLIAAHTLLETDH